MSDVFLDPLPMSFSSTSSTSHVPRAASIHVGLELLPIGGRLGAHVVTCRVATTTHSILAPSSEARSP